MTAEKLTEAQRKALRTALLYDDLWIPLSEARESTRLALWRRGLVDRAENSVTGNTFYRITGSGIAALATPAEGGE